jgi:hypothetical protein
MSNYTKQLEDWEQTFDTYLEFEDESDYKLEIECLRDYYEENYCDWDKEHEALYWKVEGLVDVAKVHFDDIYRQECLDEDADQRSYLGSEGNH